MLAAGEPRETEPTLDALLARMAEFPPSLVPPDLEEEAVSALEALARSDPLASSERARLLVDVPSPGGAMAWAARRVLISQGDLETIRFALDSYFDAEDGWARALSASDDVRLRDFRAGAVEREPPGEKALLRALERNLAKSRDRAAIRALLSWAASAPDSSSPRRVLQALPDDVPFQRSIQSFLRGHSAAEDPPTPLFDPTAEPLAVQQRVLSLPAADRERAMLSLARSDHVALLGLPMSAGDIDRLCPYLARSSRRAVRERIHRSRSERGRALASLLLAPAADREEKQVALEAMRDAWAEAIACGGRPLYEIVLDTVGPEELKRFVAESEPSESFLDALAVIPLDEARVRLERIGTAGAIERIARRPDRVLAIGALLRLRRGPDLRVSRAADLALLSLGAPGVVPRLQAELETSTDLDGVLETAVRAPLEADLALAVVRRAARSSDDPRALFAALFQMESRHPAAFLSLLSPGAGLVGERAFLAMSLSRNPARVPLWIDRVTGAVESTPAVRDAAFSALAESDLGPFAGRLHRLAGHPDREVRFRAAAALVPGGEAWTVRLLLGTIDASSPREREIARRALERLGPERSRSTLRQMVDDATAGSFGCLMLLELDPASPPLALQRRIWELVAEEARASSEVALLAASRLSLPEAIAVVTRRLTPRGDAW